MNTRTRGVKIDFSVDCAHCGARMHGGNRVEVIHYMPDQFSHGIVKTNTIRSSQYFHFTCYSEWKRKAS